MARIFKPTYTRPLLKTSIIITRRGKKIAKFENKRGQRRIGQVCADGTRVLLEVNKYHITYKDENGILKTVVGYADRKATEQYAAELEKTVQRVTGHQGIQNLYSACLNHL